MQHGAVWPGSSVAAVSGTDVPLGFAYDAHLYPAGIGIFLGDMGYLGVFSGVGTSGVTARQWRRGGQSFHHIIDPATSLPATTPWRVVTVAASTCVEANIASTAAVIIGDAAPDWLQERGLAARLVRNDGSVLRIGGWPMEAAG